MEFLDNCDEEVKLHERDNIKIHAYNIILIGTILLSFIIILRLSVKIEIQNGIFFSILVNTILINIELILFWL